MTKLSKNIVNLCTKNNRFTYINIISNPSFHNKKIHFDPAIGYQSRRKNVLNENIVWCRCKKRLTCANQGYQLSTSCKADNCLLLGLQTPLKYEAMGFSLVFQYIMESVPPVDAPVIFLSVLNIKSILPSIHKKNDKFCCQF